MDLSLILCSPSTAPVMGPCHLDVMYSTMFSWSYSGQFWEWLRIKPVVLLVYQSWDAAGGHGNHTVLSPPPSYVGTSGYRRTSCSSVLAMGGGRRRGQLYAYELYMSCIWTSGYFVIMEVVLLFLFYLYILLFSYILFYIFIYILIYNYQTLKLVLNLRKAICSWSS